MGENIFNCAIEISGILDAERVNACSTRDRGEVRVNQLCSAFEKPGGLHFHGDKSKNPVIEYNHFDRELLLYKCEKVSHQHSEAAITG